MYKLIIFYGNRVGTGISSEGTSVWFAGETQDGEQRFTWMTERDWMGIVIDTERWCGDEDDLHPDL